MAMYYNQKLKAFLSVTGDLHVPLSFLIQIISTHMRYEPDTSPGAEAGAKTIVINKVGMIKFLRSAYIDKEHGNAILGLKEAKDLIEHMMTVIDCCASMALSDETKEMFFHLRRNNLNVF